MNRRGISLALIVALHAPTAAHASTAEQCVAASTKGQELRDDGKLRAALEAFSSCSHPTCPAPVRRDCTHWSEQVHSALPTIAVGVRDAAGSLVEASVVIDGTTLTERLAAKAYPLDPGVHLVRVTASGYQPFQQSVSLAEGEKRVLDVALVRDDAGSTPTALGGQSPAKPVEGTTTMGAPVGAPQPSLAPTASHTETRGRSLPAVVAGGVGLLGLGGFGYFWLVASNEFHSLKDRCSPSCTDDEIAPARTHMTLAYVSLGVGLVAAGVATWLWLSGGSTSNKTGVQALLRAATGELGAF
jgi:hypothetical protein